MNDSFDPTRVAFFLSMNVFALAGVILVSAGRYPRGIARSLYIFGGGRVLLGIGLLLVALRAELPELLSVVLANLLAVAGFYANYPAVRALQGKPFSFVLPAVALLLLGVGTAYFALVVSDLRGVRVLVSAVAMAICALLAYELCIRFEGEGRAHIISGVTALICLAALAGRLTMSMQHPAALSPSIYPSDLSERIFIVIGYLGSTVVAVTFILLCSDAFNAELKRLAVTDALSGLANRRRLLECGEEEVRRSRRFGRSLSVLMLDIDHFKRINDTWGHAAGDQAIRGLGGICLATVRDVDIVGRLGGEEFAIVLPETSLEEATQIAERLRLSLEKTRLDIHADQPISMTVSIGVATLAEGEQCFAAVLQRADAALYTAKHGGRNQVCTQVPDARSPCPDHDDVFRTNIPTAEFQEVMRAEDRPPVQVVAYARRDRDLDPRLVWRGKDEQDWSD